MYTISISGLFTPEIPNMSEREEKELIKKRASYKGRLTNFTKYINELSGSLSLQQVNELQLRIGKIECLYDHYDEVQLKIECLVDDIDAQSSERNDFESLYYQSLSKAQELISSNTKILRCDNVDNSRLSNHNLVKLPTIDLPKFHGSYDNWLEFHDMFTSLIHSNDAMDEINKFHYLRSSLEGSAALIIQSMEFSASNYAIAWELLCNRFNNKRLLVQNHVNNLFNVDLIKSESSINIKRLIDQFNKNLRALEMLGEPTQHWDTLLIHIMTRKLDQKTFREWEECKGRINKNDPISMSVFLEFLRNRADLLETMELSRNNGMINPNRNAHKLRAMISLGNNVSRPVCEDHNCNSSIKPCPKCKGDHSLHNCSLFLNLTNEQRFELVSQYKICYNCLRPGHYSNNCKKPGCKVCKRKHNTLIHISNIKKPNLNISVRASDHDFKSPSQSSSNNQAEQTLTTLTTYSDDVHLKLEQDVLLSTALVKVFDVNGCERVIRVLLDCASSSCIITESLRQSLKLKYINVDKPIYGINKTKVSTTKMCRVKIHSITENYSKDLSCYVLSTITDSIPSRSINISHLNIPHNITLADPYFFKAGDIDMIIGTNLFWELLGSEKISLGTNQPILWETRLGWLVSGPINGGCTSSPIICNYSKMVDNNFNNEPVLSASENDDIYKMISRFWQLEEVSHKSSYSLEERMCEEHFIKHTFRLEDGRFCVRIPLKESPEVLGDSLQRAKRCLLSLERRLINRTELFEAYVR